MPGFDELTRLHESTAGTEALSMLKKELSVRWPLSRSVHPETHVDGKTSACTSDSVFAAQTCYGISGYAKSSGSTHGRRLGAVNASCHEARRRSHALIEWERETMVSLRREKKPARRAGTFTLSPVMTVSSSDTVLRLDGGCWARFYCVPSEIILSRDEPLSVTGLIALCH